VDTLVVLRLLHKDEPHVKDMSNCTACYLDAFVYIETVPLHLRV
jgi:hypothetical protein